MPAALASCGTALFTVTEPVPIFAEPAGSPCALRMIVPLSPLCMPLQPAADSASVRLNAIVNVLVMITPCVLES
jgi:hypothetical protein